MIKIIISVCVILQLLYFLTGACAFLIFYLVDVKSSPYEVFKNHMSKYKEHILLNTLCIGFWLGMIFVFVLVELVILPLDINKNIK